MDDRDDDLKDDDLGGAPVPDDALPDEETDPNVEGSLDDPNFIKKLEGEDDDEGYEDPDEEDEEPDVDPEEYE